jgi:two-component system, OmpR family, sensor histidine kinase BaeS
MSSSLALDELIHDMRNELAVAKANLEGLADGKLEPTHARFVSILQALDHLQSLIAELHSVEMSADIEVHPVALNVCELLNREFSAMQAFAAAKPVTVSIHRCPAPTAACMNFYADPVRIGQIVKNVLINAVNYTPAGGSISIDCHRRADQLEVRISDTGPGVSERDRERIFEPGFRGSASAGTEGSGYGLATVKRLVEAHGGTVTPGAAFAGGATFSIRLPGKII